MVALCVITTVGLSVATAPTASACSCVSRTDEEALADADVAFVGEVVGVDRPGILSGSSPEAAVWTFDVREVYKGAAAARQSVATSATGASCGLELPESGSVVVFASTKSGALFQAVEGASYYANLCNGTRVLGEKPVPASFGLGTRPVGGTEDVVSTRSPWIYAAGFAIVLAVAALAIVAMIRFRRRRPQTL